MDNLWPDTDIKENKVTYRYHVFTHFGYAKDKDGDLMDGRRDRKAGNSSWRSTIFH